ncbi:MAG: transketolase family protein [archaeon]
MNVSMRDGYGKALSEIGSDKNIVVLCADLSDSTRAEWFREKYPDRFVEVGVAEQNMAGIAAGMASLGKTVFISSFAAFNPGRNWDQIRVSICYSNLNVKIQGCHAGITVGADGATHQALEDIALMRCLPNMTVVVPCDAEEGRKATIESAKLKGPVYLRFARENVPVLDKVPFKIGRAEVLRDGKDVAIVACGIMVHAALSAAEELAGQGIDAMVINNHTIKPIDRKTLVMAARKTGKVVTAEEHQVQGGMGSAVAEVLSVEYPVPMAFVGVKDLFGESGKPGELLDKYGLASRDIVGAVKRLGRHLPINPKCCKGVSHNK